MRKCPICDSNKRETLWRADFLVPDGWTQPAYLEWMRCECGMIYGDNPTITQDDYDTYYIERYGYGVIGLESTNTLMERGDYIANHFPKDSKIIDFGGGESGLPEYLGEMGYTNVTLIGCRQELPGDQDVIVAHHVIEHIYDVQQAMNRIAGALKEGGTLIVDVPDSGAMAFELGPDSFSLGDYTQVHINHFRVIDMLNLMRAYGFEMTETHSYHARFGTARMYVFVKGLHIMGEKVRDFVVPNIAAKVDKLRKIGNRAVIVWGFGDIASHCLAQVKLNVQYYVCNDPAFKGATIGGLPVLDEPNTNHPIVVLSQAQRGKLIERIKATCQNEIIVI